ncbi:MAG TPA: hypothetical protein VFX96_09875 [Pyrinomonadaceae bacterium]|nr:hypothetical protein [Pyrinomonadaceae bacterium]
MKTVKLVVMMCVALFVLWAAFGFVLGAQARCSETRPRAKRANDRAVDARLAQPALPGLRFVTVAPVY